MLGRKPKGADKVVVQNAVKTLAANISFASIDNPIKSIVLTSSVPNEGKSTVSVNLAQALASSGKTVLLVECDMRRRSLANIIGLHASNGLFSVLSGRASLDEAVLATSQRGLYFLDAEPHIPNPADILISKRFARLVGDMESSYDYVIFDTPPVGTFVDAAILSSLADATALVVRENYTKREDIVNAYDQLQKAKGSNVIGVVMNCCETESSEYYYEYYNKDGRRQKQAGANATAAPAVGRGAGAHIQ